jgi:hypothetical protein
MRTGRILATLATSILVSLPLLSACKATDALSTQEIVVHFAPNSPELAHVQVQQTCGLLPNVSPEPIPSPETSGQAMTDVHFLVKPASDFNIKRLYDCLGQEQFRGVVIGYDNPDM